MISAQNYYDIYLVIVTFITLVLCIRYKFKVGNIEPPLVNSSFFDIRTIFLLVFMVLFIGLRPINAIEFADTIVYTRDYEYWKGMPFEFDPIVENKIWDNLFRLWASFDLGISALYCLTVLVNFGCTLLACRKLFGENQYIAFITFLGAFSTFSYAVNGIKAGLAAALFLLGVSYFKNWRISVPLVLVSWGFHHSMILPLAAFFLAHMYKNPKHYFYVWCLCVLISALHITFFQELFANIAEDRGNAKGASYLLESSDNGYGGKAGFRIDFILYSAMPILVGCIAIFKKKIQLSDQYVFLMNLYLIINSIWILCMYAEFTNRIAYLSWFMYPILLIYPFLREEWGWKRYNLLSKVVFGQLAFTLFMHIIYYE